MFDLQVLEDNVKRGSRVFESGHVRAPLSETTSPYQPILRDSRGEQLSGLAVPCDVCIVMIKPAHLFIRMPSIRIPYNRLLAVEVSAGCQEISKTLLDRSLGAPFKLK